MQGISISWKSIQNSDLLLKWLQQHFLCNPLTYNHRVLLQGAISKPSPALEINDICPLLMPCFSEVTPVVETTREVGKPVGFKRPRGVSRPRNIAQIKRFAFSRFEQKKNRWSNRSPVIQRKWAFSAFILSTVLTARRERGNANNSMLFQHPAGVNGHLIYALVIGPGLPVCLEGLIFWLFVQNPQELVVVLIAPWYKCFQSTWTGSLCILSTHWDPSVLSHRRGKLRFEK